MFIPIKLGNYAIEVFEVAKKRHPGFYNHRLHTGDTAGRRDRYGLDLTRDEVHHKKEFDDEVKYFKGLLN